MKKGIIFDMDGTLWDSTDIVAKSWTDAIRQWGIPDRTITPEDMRGVMGLTMDRIAKTLFSDMEGEEQTKLLDYCCKVENEYIIKFGGVLYPDLEETWTTLKNSGYHLYIVSNCQKGYIEAFLEHYGFGQYFEDIECFGNNGLKKGENIKNVVLRNNLDYAVYVGDIQGDYDAAMEAGVEFIHAAYGFGTINAPVRKIERFCDLVNIGITRETHRKIAIVTGASSGMGREFVLKLENYITVDEIWVIARRKEMLESLNGKTKAPIKIIALDLTKEVSFDEYNKLLSKATPDVGLLINCAGFGNFGSHENIPLNDSLDMINLNCRALVAITELTLPYMTKGSKIIQLDSLSAFQPVPYMTVYGATKAFVLSYSRAMNKELMSRGIRMMSVNPGWVKTEFFNTATKTNDSKVNYYNKLYEASDVVDTALKDLYKTKKDVSIHGFPVRMQVRLVKLLPHSLIMKIWLKQQQKSKNYDKLTT